MGNKDSLDTEALNLLLDRKCKNCWFYAGEKRGMVEGCIEGFSAIKPFKSLPRKGYCKHFKFETKDLKSWASLL